MRTEVEYLGPSSLVPFIPYETVRDRHQRRVMHAGENLPFIQDWCAALNISLRIQNNSNTYLFDSSTGHRARWTPSTANFSTKTPRVRDFPIIKYYKAHDYLQVLSVLIDFFPFA